MLKKTGDDVDDSGFWEWFSSAIAPTLAAGRIPPDDVLATLDSRMRERDLSWEIGPNDGGAKSWAFAVSFGADARRLSRAAELVRQAPELPECRVVLGKPPKEWDGTLELQVLGEWRLFETGGWLCKLVPAEEKQLVVVRAEAEVAEESSSMAADIAVQSVIGETPYVLEVARVLVMDPEGFATIPGEAFELLELGSMIKRLTPQPSDTSLD